MVLLAAACFGGIPILVTIGSRDGASLVGLLFWRYLIGAALLALLAGGPRAFSSPGSNGARITFVLGAMQAAVAFVSLSALRYIPAATLTFLFYTYPAWITLLEAARGRERLTGRRIGALVLALGGVGTMVGAGSAISLDIRGVLLALASALLYAVYVPLAGEYQRRTSSATLATYASAGAAVAFGVAALATSPASFALPLTGWTSALVLAVVSTAAGFQLFLGGLEVLGPVRTAILSTLEPFCTTVLAALVLGQRVSSSAILGGVLIAAAVVVLQWRAKALDGATA